MYLYWTQTHQPRKVSHMCICMFCKTHSRNWGRECMSNSSRSSSDTFTYVYVYWVPNSALKERNAHVVSCWVGTTEGYRRDSTAYCGGMAQGKWAQFLLHKSFLEPAQAHQTKMGNSRVGSQKRRVIVNSGCFSLRTRWPPTDPQFSIILKVTKNRPKSAKILVLVTFIPVFSLFWGLQYFSVL